MSHGSASDCLITNFGKFEGLKNVAFMVDYIEFKDQEIAALTFECDCHILHSLK